MAILELHDVSKQFGDKSILNELNFSVPEGSIFGFVGENGAGKTTTMKMILGLETIDSGSILVDGKLVRYGDSIANKVVGYLPDVPEYYGYMTPTEYLTLCGHITGMNSGLLKARINEMLKTVDLPIDKHRIHGFSRGMKQRLGIAQALLNEPKLLICDEPTSALDPNGRSEFLNLLASLRGKTTIIFSTHILTDVERIADRVGILHDGVLKANDSLVNLKRQFAKPQLILTFESKTSALQAGRVLGNNIQIEDKKIILNYTGEFEAVAELTLSALLKEHLIPTSMNGQDTTLEDIFMEVTTS